MNTHSLPSRGSIKGVWVLAFAIFVVAVCIAWHWIAAASRHSTGQADLPNQTGGAGAIVRLDCDDVRVSNWRWLSETRKGIPWKQN